MSRLKLRIRAEGQSNDELSKLLNEYNGGSIMKATDETVRGYYQLRLSRIQVASESISVTFPRKWV